MKKTIAKNEYDTESATLIRKYTYGSYGDPCGYEEALYQTEKGLYFLYVLYCGYPAHCKDKSKRLAGVS